MKKILFQGDSITDALRSRELDRYMGGGYATLVAAQLGHDRPNEFEFINRGISGNRITNLISRIKEDFINLKPDYLSILIGINDVWHEVSRNNGVSSEKYERYYNFLIEDIKEALPEIKIMILEPFVLKGTATEENWEYFETETKKRAEAAKRVAQKNSLVFVPLWDKFIKALEKAPASYWLADGVHPTAAGHEIIKREWLSTFESLEK
ncbi:MAG: SGNH/GDSL hydrolase family protein [Clostridia bacterium]|nr:SGNH/GDSL hydrolase family protein [Clostridia bacterium]